MCYFSEDKMSLLRRLIWIIISSFCQFAMLACNDNKQESKSSSDTIVLHEYEAIVMDTVNHNGIQIDAKSFQESEKISNSKILNGNNKYDPLEPPYVYDPDLTEDVLASYDSIHLNNKVYYVTEGDILIPKSELLYQTWSEKIYEMFSPATPKQPQHYHIQKNILRYDSQKKAAIKWTHFPITFCFDKASFKNDILAFKTVRDNFLKAINEWKQISGVTFQYKDILDNSPDIKSGTDVDFVISYFGDDSKKKKEFVATAFFPESTLDMRVIAIYPAYWTTDYDKVGVFRHELGHVFGFRHEEMSKSKFVPIFCRKKGTSDQVYVGSTYDKISVMHYFCGGNGSRALNFSDNDKINFLETYPKSSL